MKNIATKCVQAGYKPKNGEPRVAPIVQSTTFYYETPEEMSDLFDLKKSGYFYTRLGNPTMGYLEEKVAALEGGVGAMATASGMSAILIAVTNLCEAGDNFLSMSTIYGGTYNLFNVTLRKLGIECRFFGGEATEAEIEALIDSKTKLIFIETLANPAMLVPDFARIAAVAQKHGIVLMADSTLTTPVICRPIEHGVNIVVHSSTKYLDGHAASVGGIIVDDGKFPYLGNPRYPRFNEPDASYHGMVFAKDAGAAAYITRARVIGMRDFGAQMAPMNAWLTMKGIETLHLRMPRHSSNALAVARMLKGHPAVEWVKYAGLPGDANFDKVQKYFDGGMASGMVTFGIKGGREAAARFQKALRLFAIVTHIADCRSCVLHPASTTHRQLSDTDLIAAGISDNLVRLSVGIEGESDILEDLLNALEESQK
ncbi:MAG: O-acetylhomoserine aminocarboxypropyltransferase/cysteine synthase [Clostridiales bacterium]|jgi:O-acetylhomoserine (thiol)-lyase|nr:O-acetylhomoserine aminocarboxypropyltransferase/cysteine synthase [Clostridiales bacterium]HOB63755.1 O-acetylhomoserine aminocarboxypropyltransferase/cysteine synthase [Clostridia bacterium]HOK82140.1 O-acetylhomoserine aminocarboxypropyltransferase/cysteine synthase [Clostridia bacterium]HOL61080.1 O-acetylhomoserine aminocarboxypropyltransferase/cysteine synthase [Clostridia bacterium]HPO53992.1 O-acetylhomoserine aminocarboxypropyltransferase/cysteine synthase [Clostridia bacterium]